MRVPLDIPGLSFVSLHCQLGNDVNPCAQWAEISDRMAQKTQIINLRLAFIRTIHFIPLRRARAKGGRSVLNFEC